MSRSLNGLEIKKIALATIEKAIDRIPMLGENLTYHGFEMEIGYSCKSFPEHVPVPPAGEIGPILVLPPTAEIQAEIQKYIGDLIKLTEIRDRLNSILADAVVEDRNVVGIDGNNPDQARVNAGMPPDTSNRPFNPLAAVQPAQA